MTAPRIKSAAHLSRASRTPTQSVCAAASSAGITPFRLCFFRVLPLWAGHLGQSASTTSIVFGLAGLVDTLTFYPSGKIMDRAGRLWIAVPVSCRAVMISGS